MFVKVENILKLYAMVHCGTFHVYGFAPFSRGEKRLFSRVFGRFVTDPMSHSKAYRCHVIVSLDVLGAPFDIVITHARCAQYRSNQ